MVKDGLEEAIAFIDAPPLKDVIPAAKTPLELSWYGEYEGTICHTEIIAAWQAAIRKPITYEFVKPESFKFLFPFLEYGHAKHYPWDRVGCNGHYQIKAVHWNTNYQYQADSRQCPRWIIGPRPDRGLVLKGFIRTEPVPIDPPQVIGEKSDRWPLRLHNQWIIEVAKQYGYSKVPCLGITRFPIRDGADPVEVNKIKLKKFSYYYLDYREYAAYYEPTTTENRLGYWKSDLPDRIILYGELAILPDAISYPIKRNPNAKESNGWIMPGPTEDCKLLANLAPGTRLFVAPIENKPIKRGGGPIVRTGKKEPREEKNIDAPLKWLTTREYRSEYLTHLGKLDAPNGRPRPARPVDTDIESNIDATKREPFQDDYESPTWSSGDQGPSGENADFGNVIPHLEESFLGEGYLIQGEEGSERISLDNETTIHYCKEEHYVTIREPVDMWRKCSNRYYLKSLYKNHEVKKHRSYMGRTVWYNEPGKNDRRWHCLICVKKSGKFDVGNKKQYHRDDIELIKAIGVLGRKKTRPDYRLEIHYPNHKERLDCEISKYLQSQADKDQFDPNNGGKSFFQPEPVRDDEYLRTAVLTALEGIDHKPYRLKSKGGRRRGKGATSIKKWCDRYLTHHVPYDDKKLISEYQLDPKPRGVIDVIFEVKAIRKILNELKSIADKPPEF